MVYSLTKATVTTVLPELPPKEKLGLGTCEWNVRPVASMGRQLLQRRVVIRGDNEPVSGVMKAFSSSFLVQLPAFGARQRFRPSLGPSGELTARDAEQTTFAQQPTHCHGVQSANSAPITLLFGKADGIVRPLVHDAVPSSLLITHSWHSV